MQNVLLYDQKTTQETNGKPQIPIGVNSNVTQYAIYESGSGSNTLIFRLILTGLLTAHTNQEMSFANRNGLTDKGIELNNSVITYTSGNNTINADLVFSSPPSMTGVNSTVTAAPSITTITKSIADGTIRYNNSTPTNMDFTVTFDAAVDVVTTNGTPYLELTMNGFERKVEFR